MRRIAIVLVLAVLAGCALGIKGPAKGTPVRVDPDCDTGRGGVVADGLLGAVFALGGAGVAADDEVGAGLGLMALGGLMVASAVRGNNAANACVRAEAAYASYVKTLERDRRVAKQKRARVKAAPAAAAFTPAAETRPPRALPTPTEAATALAAGTKPVKPRSGSGSGSGSGSDPDPDPDADPDADPDPQETGDWSAFWEVAP